MPRLNRRSKRRSIGLTQHHRFELETGHGWPFLKPDECFHGDREAQLAGWEVLRKSILREWILTKPGTRPWAWWTFDAPERRRSIEGVHPFDCPERQESVAQWAESHPKQAERACELYYGCPALLITKNDFGVVYESQAVYLSRLGLLTEGERTALSEARKRSTGRPEDATERSGQDNLGMR